jgi:adenine-specific DNA-methyltransferase
MAKRLRLAKNLLSDRGVIFISIDDNEQAQLKLLCDEVFGEENFVANIIWQKVYSPRMDAKGFSVSHDYILTYKKIPSGNIQKLQFEQNTKQFNSFDKKRNQFYRARSLRKDGSNSLRADRPNLFYPLIAPDGQEIFPIKPDGKEGNWRWSLETYKANVMEENVEWVQKNGKWDILVKQWKVDDAQMPPPTLWLSDEVGHNHEAAEDIKSIFSESSFSTPKPLRLLKRILQIGGDKSATILDFFAGSGTTLHAVMALNAEDGGRRQCILVTNNENNICEEVTYERNRRVIEGYTNAKGVAVAGLAGNNLRYYRAGYVPSLKTEANKRALTQASTELLCLKENCYNDLTEVHGLAPSQVRVFGGEGGRLLVVVYYSRQMLAVMEQLVAVVETIDRSQHIKVYAFGPEKETLVEDLYPIADRIEIVPLPDAIYQAYRACFRTLKLDRAIINPTEA